MATAQAKDLKPFVSGCAIQVLPSWFGGRLAAIPPRPDEASMGLTRPGPARRGYRDAVDYVSSICPRASAAAGSRKIAIAVRMRLKPKRL